MLKGPDVSHYQGNIDFSILKTVRDFIIIKATEGVGYTDDKFLLNQTGARNAGMLLGYYHFARPDLGNTADAEATWFLKAIGSLKEGEVLCLDFEVSFAGRVVWCKSWLDKVFSVSKCKPVIYLNKSLAVGTDWSEVINAGYGLWLADYSYDPNSAVPSTKWPVTAFRQYSNKETVKGISGGADDNVFYGDTVAFKAYGFRPSESESDLQKELDEMRESRNKWKTMYEELKEKEEKETREYQEHIKNLQSSIAEQSNTIVTLNQTISESALEKTKLLEERDALKAAVVDITTKKDAEIARLTKLYKEISEKCAALEKKITELQKKLKENLAGYTKWELFKELWRR